MYKWLTKQGRHNDAVRWNIFNVLAPRTELEKARKFELN